jgi:hypothetical protein
MPERPSHEVTEAESFEEFVEAVQQINREFGETYLNVPGGDWNPSIWMNEPGKGVIALVLPPPFIDGDIPKEALAAAMEQLVTKVGCNMAAFSSSSWMVKLEKHEADRAKAAREDLKRQGRQAATYGDLDSVPPSQHPNRVEAVVIYCADEDGRGALSMADITRDEEDRPTLGEWETKYTGPGDDDFQAEGRFVEPLKRAMMRRKAASN